LGFFGGVGARNETSDCSEFAFRKALAFAEFSHKLAFIDMVKRQLPARTSLQMLVWTNTHILTCCSPRPPACAHSVVSR